MIILKLLFVFFLERQEKIMADHFFNFDGGEELTKMGATWFVSYFYYKKIDQSHLNWKDVSTSTSRISRFNRTVGYHIYWLEQITDMNDSKLNTNTIGLRAGQIKKMARDLLV